MPVSLLLPTQAADIQPHPDGSVAWPTLPPRGQEGLPPFCLPSRQCSFGRSPAQSFTTATWQLVINTGTTIITFLMVFLIQNTQNRDTLALQVKLSELILAVQEADDRLAAIDEASDEELRKAHEKIKAKAGPPSLT